MATHEITKTQNKLIDKLNQANEETDLNQMLDYVKKIDNTCKFPKCKKPITNFAIDCKYCKRQFCTTHGLPEVHGCGEAVKREERKNFLHPHTKLLQEEHQQVANKLGAKLKKMQFDRKAKQCSSKSKK